ncbi:hypothetical protein Rhopal_004953-T1 [Rhodotorula paludigena]|uniref:Major facilitator superfamily (MFS) profile domain-containing protein n=1 Tax=Rhodotorula paludigena TaxID=86838 RepID=A0AAV5GTI1_9BASI|nr:hypothetical protein Rhopal_004953-T1 [Rhodotorula paludigena]
MVVSASSSVEKPDKRMGVEDKQLEESASSVLEDGTTPVAKAPGSQLSLRETFSVWRKGVFCYDTILLNSLYAAPAFQRAYGVQQPAGNFIIPTAWQSALGSGTNAALIIGIVIGAPLIDRFGYRWCMIGGLLWNFAFAFLIFFSRDLPMLLAGNMLCGLPWGMFAIAAVAYAVEVVPTQIRSYLSVIGHLIGAGVLKASLDYNSEWTYKLPFLLIFMIPIPLAIALFFAPESPYYLARKGRLEEAAAAMDRLHRPHPSVDSRELVEQIAKTHRIETEMKTGGKWQSCFQGVNLRRTEIAVISWTSPGLVGFVFQFFATFFFTRAGFPPDKAFALGLGNYAIAFVGTVTSWFLQAHLGRRTIILYGYCVMLPLVTLVACLDFAKTDSGRWAQAILLMVCIAAESPAIKLRAKTLALARGIYYIVLILSTTLAPYFFQTWNLKGKSAFPAVAFTAILFVWSFFRLPEMKGRSFEELDILFALRIPARKFKSYVITAEDKRSVGHH